MYPFAKVYHEGTVLLEDCFSKIRASVYVDIFPVDGFPDNGKSLSAPKWSRRVNMCLVACKNAPLLRSGRAIYKTALLCVLRSVLWMFPARFFIERFQREVKKHGFENNPFVADMTWGYGERQCVPASAFTTFVDVDFEGRKAKALVGWDIYLRNVFGDYMQLPPLEKRVSKHSFRAWVRE